ncbi:rodhanase family protein, putative [Entamoeba histolytica KU27]|uniref:protein-tyrosine-phosphatase n=2 Tax=Entamoeba histolytica TaxID=5759 RepID=S0AVM9_ENTHI|nr:rodhanase family protein, putative [Entamoeba histolytica KU27]BAN39093.1 rodhanase-like domain containing protein [Entamoeba histolytica]
MKATRNTFNSIVMTNSVGSLSDIINNQNRNSTSELAVSDSPSPRISKTPDLNISFRRRVNRRQTLAEFLFISNSPEPVEENVINYNTLLPSERTMFGVNSITPVVLWGALEHHSNIQLIDCRFPYEFAGGRIHGAINIWNEQLLNEHFPVAKDMPQSSSILIFYCEYSGERGPSLAKKLHSIDKNSLNPYLIYNEIYVIENGFLNVLKTVPCLIEGVHIAMDNVNYSEEKVYYVRQIKSSSGSKTPRSPSSFSSSSRLLSRSY